MNRYTEDTLMNFAKARDTLLPRLMNGEVVV
jgi:hypothetical protein